MVEEALTHSQNALIAFTAMVTFILCALLVLGWWIWRNRGWLVFGRKDPTQNQERNAKLNEPNLQ